MFTLPQNFRPCIIKIMILATECACPIDLNWTCLQICLLVYCDTVSLFCYSLVSPMMSVTTCKVWTLLCMTSAINY